MKRKPCSSEINQAVWRILFVVVLVGFPGVTSAQTFDSGSNGTLDALNVTSNTTLELPPDGIFNYTTIHVESNATLTFERNELNTPVYLLATGDVVIDGTIDVSGQAPIGNVAGGLGGPGGFDGGAAGSVDTDGGAGQGPGGGRPGVIGGEEGGGGAYATRGTHGIDELDGEIYGTPLLIPLVGGSGGGGHSGTSFYGGGGGGGAILIASNSRILLNSPGVIRSRGGNSIFGNSSASFNSGSGGAIRLIAPRVFGNGVVDVRGGRWPTGGGSSRFTGHGRVRIDSLFSFEPGDPAAGSIGFDFQPPESATIGSTMVVFPPNNPHLDIVEAAGMSIPDGTNSSVLVQLPLGSPTNQTVVVQASNFSNNVPISVVLTPTSGDPITFDTTIDNLTENPAQATVDVTVPVNQPVHVHAWTR